MSIFGGGDYQRTCTEVFDLMANILFHEMVLCG